MAKTDDEVTGLLAKHSRMRQLHDGLSAMPDLEVLEDGEGSATFKVFLRGRTEPRQYFLTLWTASTHVNWSRQECPEKCLEAFGRLVKNSTREQGSEIKEEIEPEQILARTRYYLELLSAK